MTLLILGLLLWAGVHFIPSMAQPLKSKWIDRLGPMGYQGSFALIVLLSLVLMVVGWRSAEPETIYVLPAFTRHLAMLLVLVAFILFGASHAPSRIKQYVRHPQLLGVTVWAFAHLLANGDTRSITLFCGLGLWALLNIRAINKREGEWVKPEVPSWGVELKGMGISLIIFLLVMMAHPWFTGVALR